METIIVKSTGQIELPIKIIKKFDLQKGDKVFFVEEKDHIKIFPITDKVIDRNIGFLGTKGKLLKALAAEKKKEKKL